MSDYSGLLSNLSTLFGQIQIALLLGGFGILALFSLSLSLSSTAGGVLPTATTVEAGVLAILALLGDFYLLWSIGQTKRVVGKFYSDVQELVEGYTESVIQMEVVDQNSEPVERRLTLLRRGDPVLDKVLDESPKLLQLGKKIKGKKGEITLDIFVGLPWKGAIAKLRRSKYQAIWIGLNLEGDDEVSLSKVKAIHDQFVDIFQSYRPRNARVFLFTSSNVPKETIRFLESPRNWIPHWHIGRVDEFAATMNLVRVHSDGRFSVLSMPWLETLRQTRLEEEA